MKTRDLDLSVKVGSVELANPIMTASGTAGHGAELDAYINLRDLGAVVVKSLAAFEWEGNPWPRVSFAPGGMLNNVGLQGPGVKGWIEKYLPQLKEAKAKIIMSIWGRTIEEYRDAAALLEPIKQDLSALELNVSCPNLEDKSRMFSHSPQATAEVVLATKIDLPQWVKLSPNTSDIPAVAQAAQEAGAEAVTLTNTMPAMRIDSETKRPYLSGVTGGFSGAALKPIALRAVYECHNSVRDLDIVGAGGIRSGSDAAEFLLAGASAVQVGAAIFSNPRAPKKILKDLKAWCVRNEQLKASQLTGGAHE